VHAQRSFAATAIGASCSVTAWAHVQHIAIGSPPSPPNISAGTSTSAGAEHARHVVSSTTSIMGLAFTTADEARERDL
jgi:hypothetical protein